MIPGRSYTPFQWLTFVWRRRWYVVVTFLLVTTTTVVVGSRRPYRYRAEALVLAEPRSVAAEYVRASVTTESIKDRLPTISQQILSYTRLEQIIRDLDLYASLRVVRPMDAVVGRMRADAEVKTGEGAESFRVSYTSESPDLAVQVTERLVVPFIEEHSRNRAVLAHETSTFLEGQLAEARSRLVTQEKRLEAYRLRHGTELPTQLESNMQAVQNIQTQLHTVTESTSRAGDRRLLVARQLADLQSEQFLGDPAATAGRGSTEEATASRQKSPTAVQYDAALTELRALEPQLTSRHPDLVRARQLVTELQHKVEQEKIADSALTARRPLTAAEILKRNRIGELQAELESLDRQIEDRRTSEEQLRTEIQGYRSRVEALPTRESELASLTRDYDTLQATYRTLLAKREESKISENLEQQQVGGQFRIIDPPHRPQTPLGPSRRVIYLGGAMAGFGLGVALAVLLQLLDKSLLVSADVRAALDLPVVATIPLTPSRAERRKTRRRGMEFSVALAALVAGCATAVWLSLGL